MSVDKVTSRWYTPRLNCEVTVARWGHMGQPVLVFPTAGGDAEELERFQMIRVLEPLISAGRIKVYSLDSVAGSVWFNKQGSPEHRMHIQHQFHQFVKHEVAPAIHQDCRTPNIPIWTAGASIGAFHAAAVVCRFPDLFHKALSMSGTYDLLRFCERKDPTDDYRVSSPLYFVPHLLRPAPRGAAHALHPYRHWRRQVGEHRRRAGGWPMCWAPRGSKSGRLLGPQLGSRLVTWREMMPKYLDEWTR